MLRKYREWGSTLPGGGWVRRGQRNFQKEVVFEPGLEGQVGFCQVGKYGEWHSGHREEHMQRCRARKEHERGAWGGAGGVEGTGLVM